MNAFAGSIPALGTAPPRREQNRPLQAQKANENLVQKEFHNLDCTLANLGVQRVSGEVTLVTERLQGGSRILLSGWLAN